MSVAPEVVAVEWMTLLYGRKTEVLFRRRDDAPFHTETIVKRVQYAGLPGAIGAIGFRMRDGGLVVVRRKKARATA